MSRKSKNNQTTTKGDTTMNTEDQKNQSSEEKEASTNESTGADEGTQENTGTAEGSSETNQEQVTTESKDEVKESTPVQAPVAKKKEAVVEDEAELSVFEKIRAKVLESGTFGEKLVVEYMDNYLAVMRPGLPVDETVGARQQQNLWNVLQKSINNEPDFKKCMDVIMAYFRENIEGAFRDTHIFRFSEYTNLGELQRKTFYNIATLLKIAAGTKSKKDIRSQIDISRSVDGVFDEPARQRLMAYFN